MLSNGPGLQVPAAPTSSQPFSTKTQTEQHPRTLLTTPTPCPASRQGRICITLLYKHTSSISCKIPDSQALSVPGQHAQLPCTNLAQHAMLERVPVAYQATPDTPRRLEPYAPRCQVKPICIQLLIHAGIKQRGASSHEQHHPRQEQAAPAGKAGSRAARVCRMQHTAGQQRQVLLVKMDSAT